MPATPQEQTEALELVHRFGDLLSARFEGNPATYVAFRVAGFIVVAAREEVGRDLEGFVEDRDGSIQSLPARGSVHVGLLDTQTDAS